MNFPEKYIQLGWALLECKFVYYKGVEYDLSPIPDDLYDELESRYVDAALDAAEPASAKVVGFPESPSGVLAASAVLSGMGVMQHLNPGLWPCAARMCPECLELPRVSYSLGSVMCPTCGRYVAGSYGWRKAVKAWNRY